MMVLSSLRCGIMTAWRSRRANLAVRWRASRISLACRSISCDPSPRSSPGQSPPLFLHRDRPELDQDQNASRITPIELPGRSLPQRSLPIQPSRPPGDGGDSSRHDASGRRALAGCSSSAALAAAISSPWPRPCRKRPSSASISRHARSTRPKSSIDKLGLRNIRIEERDIRTFDGQSGIFDYIICHGTFSWVERDVQDKIFTRCSNNLAPDGLVYVSYNTYPGWHFRGLVREMMCYHARRFTQAGDRAREREACCNSWRVRRRASSRSTATSSNKSSNTSPTEAIPICCTTIWRPSTTPSISTSSSAGQAHTGFNSFPRCRAPRSPKKACRRGSRPV